MRVEVPRNTWPKMKMVYDDRRTPRPDNPDIIDGRYWCRWECCCGEVGHWIDMDCPNPRVMAVQYWSHHVTRKHEWAPSVIKQPGQGDIIDALRSQDEGRSA